MFACLAASSLTLAATSSSPADLAGSVWVASHASLSRIDPATNQVSQTLPLPHEATDVAVDVTRNGVWVLAHKHLLRFDNATSLTLELDLKSVAPGLDDPSALKLDPYDGSLWIVAEKALVHLDAQGRLLQQWNAPGAVKAVTLAIDENPWVLTEKALVRLSTQGAIVQSLDLKGVVEEPKRLAVDDVGGVLWVASEQNLVQLSLKDLTKPPRAVALPASKGGDDDRGHIEALALDPFTGVLAVVTRKTLLLYARPGNLLMTQDLAAQGLRELEAASFEPVSQNLWLGGHKRVLRLARSGDVLTSIALADEVEAIGVGAPTIFPTLVLLGPGNGVLTNNALSPVRLQLSAQCSGNPCDLGQGYLDSFVFTANLNGRAIGNGFAINGNVATYQPKDRLPEGSNTLTAQATDVFGHGSNTVTSAFTVDTIPPKFLTIAPADNSTVLTQPVTVTGSLDDATATITLDRLVDLGAAVVDASPEHFAFKIPLQPGANILTFVARDPAGNESPTALHLSYVPVRATLTGLTPGATIATDRLSVSGTVEGPPNTGVTVNGVVAAVYGGRFFVNHLALKPGENVLEVTATTPAGLSSTQTVTVTSTAPSPIEVTAEPQSGISPLTVAFTVATRQGQTVSRIEADFDGDGNPDLFTTDPAAPLTFTYTSPGVYAARITVTDSQNATTSATLNIVVHDPAERDRFFGALWGGMNDALRRGDTNAALADLNVAARAKYQPVFEALRPQMPAIIASYSPPSRLSVTESIGEYAVTRPDQGTTRVYLIYFLQDADGVWRLDEM